MSGDKDDDRRAIEQRQHFEAIELRHLDVEEENVGIALRHLADGLESVGALGDDLEVFFRSEIFAKDIASERFVVDNQGPNHVGSSISTEKRPFASSVRSDARPFEMAASRPRAFCSPMLSPRG